jgi:cathepsin F/cysteine peptidase B
MHLRSLIIFSVLVAASAMRTLQADMTVFGQFKATYGKTYSASEETSRFLCFRQNLALIEKLNTIQNTAEHGVNAFTDMCPSEFKLMHNLKTDLNKTKNYDVLFSAEELANSTASSVDWRQKGAVTPVKNQGMCGSCWTFSATGNMEGQHFLSTGTLVSLSEEELVQCANNGNMGCNGGLMDNAFEWVKQNGGITTETDYPYTSGSGVTGNCVTTKESDVSAKFSGHVDVAQDEGQMAAWVAKNGPLSIAVDASSGWQTYSGGIVTTCTGTQLDHGVLIVGYGTDSSSNMDYWIVKNSWGPTWGESGYIRLQRGTNQCGINQSPCSAKI